MKASRPLLGLLALALTSLPGQARLNVVATTSDLGSLAREIGGDRVEVTTLAKPTEDPHFVDAKPSFIVKLNRADALVEGGAELELGWLPPLLEGARNNKLAAGQPGRIACARGITMLEVPATLDRSRGDLHAAGNPHFLTDPANAGIVAETIANAFAQIDPKSADFYQANLKKFREELDAKLTAWTKVLEPYRERQIVTYHDYWPYFARRFGLKMDLFLEPKPGIPPTPTQLAEVVSRMRAGNIKLILATPYVSRRTAETVASLTGGKVLDVPAFPESAGPGSYLGWIDTVVNAIATGFKASLK